MPDLLAHVFVAYAAAMLLSWRWGWDERYVTLGMVGALIPELVKIKLLIPPRLVEMALGVSFSWGSLATGGGILLSVAVGIALLHSEERARGTVMLGVGAVTHLAADSLNYTPTGYTQQLFWPLTQYRIPSPGLYTSTQPEPTVVSAVFAGVVWMLYRYRHGDTSE